MRLLSANCNIRYAPPVWQKAGRKEAMDNREKFIASYFTKREIQIIAESLEAYNRYVGGSKQTRFEANRLCQSFAAAESVTV
jgi:hypothetical protein